nr:hypothetical protein [Comamonas testosteroni]
MSIDLFACHAVKSALLEGDLENGAAQVLCLLPQSKQESALRQLKALPEMVTGIQLLRSIDSRALDLSKAQFDRTNCASCLHNTDNASVHVESIGQLQPGKCLFSLCAQHDANDESLLNQRTVLQSTLLDSDVTDGPVPKSLADDPTMDSNAAQAIGSEQTQLYLSEPDVGEVDSSDELYDQRAQGQPMSTEAVETEQDPLHIPSADAATQAASVANAAEELVSQHAPDLLPTSYIDVVKNAWWRDALVYRVAESGSVAEMQGFLNACFASGYTMQSRPEDTPVTLFLDIVQAKQGFLPTLVRDAIKSLPLDVIQAFLIMFDVDLSDTGTVSVKLLSAHALDDLETIADELQVPESDAVCDAYDAGPEAFAQAIFDAVGEQGMIGYIPHSLRP